jgi:hypothetical protein
MESAPPAAAPAAPQQLVLGQSVEASYVPGQKARLPITLDKGKYLVEFFLRAAKQGCGAAIGLNLLDRDEAYVTNGAVLWARGSDLESWNKADHVVEIGAKGPYTFEIKPDADCPGQYRMRISVVQ